MLRCRALIAIACLLSANSAEAGAWTAPEGHGIIIANATYFTSSHYFDTNGDKQPQAKFRKYELQPYAEYGATDWLTVGGSAYAQRVTQAGTANYALSDPEIFARLRVYQTSNEVLSLQPLIKLRSQNSDPRPPHGGSTSTDGEFSLLYGRNVNVISSKDYVDARAGYRARNNGLANQWRGDLAFGMSVTDSIQLIPAMRAVYAPGLKDAATFSESGDLDYDVLKVELTGIYHLDENQWVQASVFKHVAGIQTGDGQGVSLGFAQRF